MKTIANEQLMLQPAQLTSLEQGDTLALSERDQLIAFIVPAYPQTKPRPSRLAKGKFSVPPGFNDPLPDMEKAIYES